jgi:hypothetical protein
MAAGVCVVVSYGDIGAGAVAAIGVAAAVE